MDELALGLDFGTDSVRALIVDARNGSELSSSVAPYRRWSEGAYCDPLANIFRQHPLDYLEAMETAARGALALSPGASSAIRGIGVDTTGSTPALVGPDGAPLALSPEFRDEPDAMFILWKDHSALREAADINEAASARAASGRGDYLRWVGGLYSSEWIWAKLLRVLRTNPRVASSAASAVEHCDWIPAVLTGTEAPGKIKRGRCSAGHKALWRAAHGGYPPEDFFSGLHPGFARLAASLGKDTFTSDTSAGRLSPEWRERLGIGTDAAVAVGAYDAHMGAVGGGVGKGTFLRIMGTSTCDVMVGPSPRGGAEEKAIRGICGQVDGSVIPGMTGYEAGQSAYGDIFAWFKRLLSWPIANALGKGGPAQEAALNGIIDGMLPALEAAARGAAPGSSGVISLDWLNGRRTPDADQSLKGALAGLSLGTDAPAIFRALAEGAAFGSRAIVERFESEGLGIERVSAIGGVAKKSSFVMQVLADVLNRDITVMKSDQACALGASIFGAVAAGLHPDVLSAQAVMASRPERRYVPDKGAVKAYDVLYARYRELARFEEEARHGNE
jgi:L-ribulokinase